MGVGTASAGGYNPQFDLQYTNVPWLAWAGETVKVQHCFGLGDTEVTSANFSSSSFNHGSPIIGEFDKSDWSGAVDQPPFFQIGTGDQTSRQVQPYWNPNGGVCFSTDVTSEKAGLERIKFSLSLSQDFASWLNHILPVGNDVFYQADLYVIWMWDSAPTLTESADTGAYKVGDPGGNGVFNVIADSNGHNSFQPGLLNVQVTGTFPMGNDFAGYDFTGTAAGNGTITLPTDWAWLAQHFAEDYASTYPGEAAMDWDIHDDNSATEGHVPSSFCAETTSTTIDAVDNCLGAGGSDPDLGPFSNIYGGTDNFAMGPFDPIRSLDTYLGDGKLDSYDAPMPALRVDVALTNAGADHSVGTLSKADKSAIYNRSTPVYGGTTADNADPHNLYAPFYKAYVPAVLPFLDFNTTSGVEGSIAGNYGPWLFAGEYDYWDTISLDSSNGYNDCRDVTGGWVSQPQGDTAVAVYTDEHGQAMVQFNPANEDGEGIYLTPDSNGRCDVYTGSLTGTATIQAKSVYPAQQPADPSNSGKPKLSDPITKTVNFIPSKTLNCVPKGTNEAFCVESVTDFEGNPLADVPVEFSAQAAQGGSPTLGADSAKVGNYDTRGQGGPSVNSGPIYAGGFVDLTTNDLGQAGIYVHSSTGACIDVTVENVGTRNGGSGITRDTDFNPTTGVACTVPGAPDNTGNGGGSNAGGGTTNNGGTTGGSNTATGGGAAVVVANPVSVSAPAPTVSAPAQTGSTTKVVKTVKMTLVSARVISSKAGRYLSVRVNSKAGVAKLRITLISKNGKSHVVLRSVKTNHQVRVANLKLAPSVKTVRVALA